MTGLENEHVQRGEFRIGADASRSLLATTKPSPFEYPTDPEAYTVFKELSELGNHPLASVWDHGLTKHL